jgi:hypothetical protein
MNKVWRRNSAMKLPDRIKIVFKDDSAICRGQAGGLQRAEGSLLLARRTTREDAVLDGAHHLLGWDWQSQFYDLLARRVGPFFYGFDLLRVNDTDSETCLSWKNKTVAKLNRPPVAASDLDHAEVNGSGFERACEWDMGDRRKVEKRPVHRRHQTVNRGNDQESGYSQMEGRAELFWTRIIPRIWEIGPRRDARKIKTHSWIGRWLYDCLLQARSTEWISRTTLPETAGARGKTQPAAS